jgi:drug/metabolite transporter (DMT)-like permease
VVFGERLSIYIVLAMALMFVGMFLAGYRRRSPQSP